MICTSHLDIPISYEKKPLYSHIIEIMKVLQVDLSEEEKHMMKFSDANEALWADFVPVSESESWYNIRIGCLGCSMVRQSKYVGFK